MMIYVLLSLVLISIPSLATDFCCDWKPNKYEVDNHYDLEGYIRQKSSAYRDEYDVLRNKYFGEINKDRLAIVQQWNSVVNDRRYKASKWDSLRINATSALIRYNICTLKISHHLYDHTNKIEDNLSRLAVIKSTIENVIDDCSELNRASNCIVKTLTNATGEICLSVVPHIEEHLYLLGANSRIDNEQRTKCLRDIKVVLDDAKRQLDSDSS